MTQAWPNHSTNWDKISSPFRPGKSDVDNFKKIVGNVNILLLGVTPEIHQAFSVITSIDRDPNMIKNVWPGNTKTKIAINTDWETFVTEEKFDGLIGDFAITLLADKQKIIDFNSSSFNLLNKNAVAAHRIFHKPKDVVTREQLIEMLNKPSDLTFNEFKFLMFMCYSEETESRIQQVNILKMFNEICPDRELTSKITGWSTQSMSSIDLYKNATQEIIVLSKDEWLETVPKDAVDVKFTYADGYPLSELCPILSYVKPV